MPFPTQEEEISDLQPIVEEDNHQNESPKLTEDVVTNVSSAANENVNLNVPEAASTEDFNIKSTKISRSFIGRAVFVKGDLSANEDLLINGCVEGSISLKTHTLEVGANGHIHANVFAKTVIIWGELVGDIYASDRVIVAKTGRVTGDIYTADVSIEDGANIKGNIDMQRQDVFETQAATEKEIVSPKARGLGGLFKKRASSEKIEISVPAELKSVEDVFILPSDTINAYDSCSMLGESVKIKGELAASEDVVIQGQLEGTIYFKNHNLGISAYSKIKGHVFAKSLVVYGEVKGDIYAHDLAIIKKAGRVYGNIYSPRVNAERGAVLMGMVEMGAQNIEEELNNVIGHSSIEHVCHHGHKTADKVQAMMGSEESVVMQQDDSAWPIFYVRS